MTTLPTEKYAHVDPTLVAITLKMRGGIEHTINRVQADNIGQQGANQQVRLPSGNWINTSDVSSMTVDDVETVANLRRNEKPLRMDGPRTTPEQFIAIAEAHAAKHKGFREIYEKKKSSPLAKTLSSTLERLKLALDNNKTLDI